MGDLGRCGRLLAVVAALGLALGAPSAAFAHGPGESDQAKVLVLQAIALVVNTPDDTMAIEERIDDALEAPDTEGADLDLVEQAATALAAGDLSRTRELLQTSIGSGTGSPPPAGSGEPGRPAYVVGTETGTTVVLDRYVPDAALDRGEIALLVISVAVAVVGVALSWRLRPAPSVRELRRSSIAGGGA